jgi:hypothetical protein
VIPARLRATLQGYGANPLNWIRDARWRLTLRTSSFPCIFVVGAPRSGTTLLQTLLQAHSKCFGIEAETGLFDLQSLFRPERHHFGLQGAARDQAMDEARDRIDFMDRQIRRLATETGAERFVEKTPQHVLRLRVILKSFPESKVIHIVRDGRDGFCSARGHRNIPQRRSAAAFAKYWRRCVDAGLLHDSDDRVRRCFYEDLARDPSATLEELMNWLGLDIESRQLDVSTRSSDQRARRDVFARLNTSIDTSSVGRWREELSPMDQATFLRVAGRTLEKLGYEVP